MIHQALSAAELMLQRLDREEQEETELAEWRSDPVKFAWDVFGIRAWDKQATVLNAVAQYDRVAWRSGHKVSKTNTASLLAYWFPVCFPGGRVIGTSSSHRQVEKILWREIRALEGRARRNGRLDLPHVAKSPNTGIEWPDGRDVCCFSTDQTENFGGFSGRAILFLIDEASGVPEEIFEAIEGNLAGGSADGSIAIAKVVMFGNPTQVSGTFFDAFNGQKASWKTYHISSEDSPNVKTGRVVVPGLATKEWVEGRRKAWGEDDPRYQVRVKGNFPSQDARTVIKLGVVERAVERFKDLYETSERECGSGIRYPAYVSSDSDSGVRSSIVNAYTQEDRLELGADVARFGDDNSVGVARRGKTVLYDARGSGIESVSGYDSYQVGGMLLSLARRFHVKGEPVPLVKVDVIGYGAGVVDFLHYARDERGYPLVEVVEINVAENAYDESEYFNLRTELWFACAEWLLTGAIPEHDILYRELIAPKFDFDHRGRLKLESKKEIKKRLGWSPDFADALCLAVYEPGNTGEPAAETPENQSPADGGLRWDVGRGFG
jgi:hypothetical protein